MGTDSVFVGLNMPLTGVFSGDGSDLKLGYELAIAQINAGGEIPAAWGLKGKGVLGRQIRHKIADTEGKPNVAVQAATQFIQRDKAIMFQGSVSSAEAIALEELASRDKVLYMVGIAGSNDVTGKNCQRYGFRSQQNAYMAAKALAPVVAKALGKNLKAAFLVPDYTYGQTVYDSFSKFSKEQGWTQVLKETVPLGTADYSSALLNIANRRRRCLRQHLLRVRRGGLHEAGRTVRRPLQHEARGAQPLLLPGQGGGARADAGRLRFLRLLVDAGGPLSPGQDLRGGVLCPKQVPSALGRPHRLHADLPLGTLGGAGRGVQPCRHHQGDGGLEVPALRDHDRPASITGQRTTRWSGRSRSCAARRLRP